MRDTVFELICRERFPRRNSLVSKIWNAFEVNKELVLIEEIGLRVRPEKTTNGKKFSKKTVLGEESAMYRWGKHPVKWKLPSWQPRHPRHCSVTECHSALRTQVCLKESGLWVGERRGGRSQMTELWILAVVSHLRMSSLLPASAGAVLRDGSLFRGRRL